MKHLYERLETLLDQEKEYLLNGDYPLLDTLSEKKIELSIKIKNSSSSLSTKSIHSLKTKSKRNEELLASARRGLQSAISHLSEAAEGSFQSYSKEGKRTPLSKQLNMQQKV